MRCGLRRSWGRGGMRHTVCCISFRGRVLVGWQAAYEDEVLLEVEDSHGE
jgi:hypothetical protein